MLDSMHITVDGSRKLVDPAMKKWTAERGPAAVDGMAPASRLPAVETAGLGIVGGTPPQAILDEYARVF
jgi:hypothetical protein